MSERYGLTRLDELLFLRSRVDAEIEVERARVARLASNAGCQTCKATPTSVIRAWARSQDITVGERGRIRPTVIYAYHRHHPKETP